MFKLNIQVLAKVKPVLVELRDGLVEENPWRLVPLSDAWISALPGYRNNMVIARAYS